jgi:hypothetical protein
MCNITYTLKLVVYVICLSPKAFTTQSNALIAMGRCFFFFFFSSRRTLPISYKTNRTSLTYLYVPFPYYAFPTNSSPHAYPPTIKPYSSACQSEWQAIYWALVESGLPTKGRVACQCLFFFRRSF